MNVITNKQSSSNTLKGFYELPYFDFDLFAEYMKNIMLNKLTYEERVSNALHNKFQFELKWENIFNCNFNKLW